MRTDVHHIRGGYSYEQSIVDTAISPYTERQLLNALPPESARAESEVRALNAVAGRKGKILESAAELRKSVEGLANNARSLEKFVVAVTRRDWAGAARALGVHPRARSARRARDRAVAAGGGVANAWLNYSFGIKPIIDDMVFAMVILGEPRTIRLKGVGYGRLPVERTSRRFTYGAHYSFPGLAIDYDHTIRRVSKCVLWYEVSTAALARFNELGLYSVPATIWALQPMSFVVDWVLPVQDVLQALTADVGLAFKAGTHTSMARFEFSGFRGSCVEPGVVSLKEDFTLQNNGVGVYMNRTVYRTAPVPRPIYVKDPLSVWTAVTSLALLASSIKNSMKGL